MKERKGIANRLDRKKNSDHQGFIKIDSSEMLIDESMPWIKRVSALMKGMSNTMKRTTDCQYEFIYLVNPTLLRLANWS